MTDRLIRIAAATALAAGLALAQTPAARPRLGPGKAKPAQGMVQRRVIKNLNLTDSQKQQAKAIFEQARETAKPIREQMQKIGESMRAARQANDGAQIRNLAAQQGTLRGQLLASRAEAQAKFVEILTPEQKAKMDQMRDKAGKQAEKLRQRLQQRRRVG